MKNKHSDVALKKVAPFTLILICLLVSAFNIAEVKCEHSGFTSFNIDIGCRFASGAAITPDSKTVYVMGYWNYTISVIDAITDSFVRRINLSAFNPGILSGGIVVNDKLYALGEAKVLIIDTTTEQVVNTIPQPSGISGTVWGRAVVSPSKDRVYAIFGDIGHLLVIDTSTYTLIKAVRIGIDTTGIGISPSGDKIYISSSEGTVTIVDSTTFQILAVKEFIVDTDILGYTTAVAVGHDGLVYVGYVDRNWKFNIAILDPDGNLMDVITTDTFSTGLDISKDGKYLVTGAGMIIDVNTRSVIARVNTGVGEYQVNMSPDGRRAYVTNFNSEYITVIEGFTPVPDFEIQSQYSVLSLYPIGMNMTTLTIRSVGGFDGIVSLSVYGSLPLGIFINFYPTSVYVPKNGYTYVLMVVHTNSSTPKPASYKVTIIGLATFEGNTISHTKSILVMVLDYSSDIVMSQSIVEYAVSQEFLPIGIADYGVNNGHAYSYSTKNFTGWMYFTSLDISGFPESIMGITLQMNAVINATTTSGMVQYYWVQNVINIRQLGFLGYTIAGFYNVYNETGSEDTLIGRTYFSYGHVSGVKLPFNITSSISTEIDAKGTNVITFVLRVTDQKGTLLGSGETSFSIQMKHARFSSSVFIVNGRPRRTFINAPKYLLCANIEFVLCGRSAFLYPKISLTKIGGTLFLGYKPINSESIIPVIHAFNFGLNTAEAVKNANVIPLPPSNDIFYTAFVTTGKINPTQLW